MTAFAPANRAAVNRCRPDFKRLDRQWAIVFHDGSARIFVFDNADDVVTYTDENGSVFANTWDPMSQKINTAITPAAGIGGAPTQSFQHDGLARTTLATDTTALGVASVGLTPDSIGRTVEEQQGLAGLLRFVTNSAFVPLPATQVTCPNNRAVNAAFDNLYRKQKIMEAATGAVIAAWQFFGPGRVAEVALGNGLIQTMLNNARTHSAVQGTVPNPAWGTPSSDRLGYDGAARPIAKRYLPAGINGTTFAYNNTNPVMGNTTGYDPASNKNFERALHAEITSNLYQPFTLAGEPNGGYDSINRLLQYQRGILSPTGGYLGDGGGSISTPIGILNTNQSEDFDLDSLDNWREVWGATAQSCGGFNYRRNHNRLNQITQQSVYDYGYYQNFTYDGVPGASTEILSRTAHGNIPMTCSTA